MRVSLAQDGAVQSSAPSNKSAVVSSTPSTIALRTTSVVNVPSEMGGAFMSGSKCDADGNLYIRKLASDRPLLGPVVKINAEGKRVATFDPGAFSQLGLDRADAFSPAADGGLYQIAQSGVLKPKIYVLHFSSDGTASTPVLLDADVEVYTFAAFAEGNFLISGVKRDLSDKNDMGKNFTAIFSADGRELAELSFANASKAQPGANRVSSPGANDAKTSPLLDLSEAEVGVDGNLYVMRRSSPVLVYVIAPSGKIEKILKIARDGDEANAFHLSLNRLAVSLSDIHGGQSMIVADAQTGQKIVSYLDPEHIGSALACYSANDGVFTSLRLRDGNALEVVHLQAQ